MAENRISARGQIKVYLGKCFRLFRTEKQWKNLISAAIIVVLICLVTGPDMFVEYAATNKGAFAIISACIWTGLFNSIRSICRERDIIKREYRTGLKIPSYLLAHAIYEMALCAAEALITLLFIIGFNISHLPPEGVFLPAVIEIYFTLFFVTFCADMLAMLVSCIVRSENTAMTIMPFVLVVQLVMSGVIFELGSVATYISYLTASHWGVEAFDTIARTDSTINFQAIWAGVEAEEGAGTLLKDWGFLFGFAILYLILAMVFLRRVDKDQR